MDSFENLKLPDKLQQTIIDLGFEKPTPIQVKSFPVILSGRDVVGIAQTGTGKTFAYMLPLLRDLKFSKQISPRILVLVPTRELVIQVCEQIEKFSENLNLRILGVYGGTNINTQKHRVAEGVDILVATAGRLYDLAVTGVLQLKTVNKLVIDEVDVMLDLGFRHQLTNIFDLLPKRKQSIMYSATMTDEIDTLIDEYFISPEKISIAVSGTPLQNISQVCYPVENFHTKVNLLAHLLADKESFKKVLVFMSSKKLAERLIEALSESFGSETGIIHSNKAQNYRFRSIRDFNEGTKRILISTDVMARGLDLDNITHVINFDTPIYPENYMHRIGRTGRAEQKGKSLLFYTAKEVDAKNGIENLMDYKIPVNELPAEVKISKELIPEEQLKQRELNVSHKLNDETSGGAFHEKKEKNKKTNQGGSYLRKMKTYKKPKSRGDKNFNKRHKKKK